MDKFESNHSGIETFKVWEKIVYLILFESNHSGIETIEH